MASTQFPSADKLYKVSMMTSMMSHLLLVWMMPFWLLFKQTDTRGMVGKMWEIRTHILIFLSLNELYWLSMQLYNLY
jgi:hypothetical protein